MGRRFKRKSTFSFKSLSSGKFSSVLKHATKPQKSSLRTDDDGGEGFAIMAEMWPSKADNRLAEPYVRPDGVRVEVSVSTLPRL